MASKIYTLLISFNTLPDDRHNWDDAYSIVICLFTFVHTVSIWLQHKMHGRRADAPPVMHFKPQTNKRSVQKKETSLIIKIELIVSIATIVR